MAVDPLQLTFLPSDLHCCIIFPVGFVKNCISKYSCLTLHPMVDVLRAMVEPTAYVLCAYSHLAPFHSYLNLLSSES